MHTSKSIKICVILLPLAVAAGGCGGGAGEPGGNPSADNSSATKLHPESYVERWWADCAGAVCLPSTAPAPRQDTR
jgi:hypothetical protein